MSQESRTLRAKRAKLVADAHALAHGANMTPEMARQFDRMMAKADELKGQIDRLETANREMHETLERSYQNRRGNAGLPNTAPRPAPGWGDPAADAFVSFLRGGMENLSAEHRAVATPNYRAAQSTSPDTAGGYTVPQGFYGKLIDAQLAFGGMMEPNVSFVFDTETGNALPIPTDDDTSNEGVLVSENTQVGTQDVAFGQITMNAYTYSSKLVLVSNQLLQDSAFDIGAFLSDKLGTRLARVTNRHFTVGSGASQPTGAVTGAVLGYTAGGGSTSGSTTTISFDDLVELEHSVDPAYRRNARFMMSDSTLRPLKKMKDSTGRPLWLPGLADEEPDTILGRPYTINQHMAVPSPSAVTMLFGQFSNYYIRRVAGVQVLRLTEKYADFNQVGFLAFQRWDGQLVDAGTHPIRYLRQAAS